MYKFIYKINCLSLTHLLSVPRQPHLVSRHQQDLGAVPSYFCAFSPLLFLIESVSSSAYKHLVPQIFQNQHIQNWVIFSSKPVSPPLILFPWKIPHHSLSESETRESPHRESLPISLSFPHSVIESCQFFLKRIKISCVYFLLFILTSPALVRTHPYNFLGKLFKLSPSWSSCHQCSLPFTCLPHATPYYSPYLCQRSLENTHLMWHVTTTLSLWPHFKDLRFLSCNWDSHA